MIVLVRFRIVNKDLCKVYNIFFKGYGYNFIWEFGVYLFID